MTLIVGDPRLFGAPDVIGSSSGDVLVRIIAKDQADAIIRTGHYSHTTAWASTIHLGIYVAGALVGAMQYGPGMNPGSGGRIVSGSTPETWLELNRLWLTDDRPPNTTSRAIACSLKIVRHRRPRVEWIQSFADERCGKLGGIYQACSFIYCGEHTSTFYEIDGEVIHKSMLDRPAADVRGWSSGPRVAWAKRNRDRAVEVTYQQFRYVKFLRSSARRRLLLPSLPYPKPSERSVVHSGG